MKKPKKEIKNRESILLKGSVEITVRNHKFLMPIKAFLGSRMGVFECKKCYHRWLPRDKKLGNIYNIPKSCPKCDDVYWFLSKEQIKQMQKNKVTDFTKPSRSIGIPQSISEPIEKKQTIIRESDLEW